MKNNIVHLNQMLWMHPSVIVVHPARIMKPLVYKEGWLNPALILQIRLPLWKLTSNQKRNRALA